MADVQQEKGHIRIANNLYRAVTLAKVTPIQRCAILECLWRQYGWAKKGKRVQPFPLGGTDLGKSIGCSRPTASTAISGLVEMRVLLKTTSGRFVLEKDFDRWRCGFNGDPDRVHWTAAHGYLDPSEVLADDDAERNEMLTPALADGDGERNEMLTPVPPESPPVVDSPEPLEPKRTNESQGEPPKPPKGGGQFSLIAQDPPKPDPILEIVFPGYMVGRNGQGPDPDGDFRDYTEKRLAMVGSRGRKGPKCSPADLVLISEWVLNCPTGEAMTLRSGGHTKYATIYKALRFEVRLMEAREWDKGGRSTVAVQRPRNGQPVYRNKPGSRDITPEMEADFEKYKIEMKERGIG